MRKKGCITAAIILMLAVLSSSQLCLSQQKLGKEIPMQAQEKSLYQRLGGYDAIAAVVDDFIARLLSDAQLSRFFAGHSLDSKKRIRQQIVEQLCMATGGPCFYTGRTMKASHEGMNITENEWETAVRHLVASLDKFRVPQREKDEVLGAISSFKPDIVAPK